MLEFEAIQFLDSLDAGVDEALSRFSGRMVEADRELFARIDAMLSKLDLKGVDIAKTAKNVRYINQIRSELNAAVKGGKYSSAVNEFIGSFQSSAGMMDLYFSAMVSNFGTKPVYEAIVKEYIEATVEGMYAGGLSARFKPVLTDILKTHVTTGAPLQELRRQVKNAVINDKQLSAYAEAVADNALNQFSRNYLQAVSEDLGLKHYFYKGTVIESSREFCRKRVGNYYTEEEVLDWADLQYAGKIKTTTRANIKTNLGGNRCRHRLAPITEGLYNLKTKGLRKK